MVTNDSNYSVSRRRYLTGLGVGAAAGLAGVTGGAAAAQDGQVTMWHPLFDDKGNAEFVDWYKKQVEQKTGASWQLSSFTYMDTRQKFLTGAQTGTPDVVVGVLSHTSEYVKAGNIEPLDDRLKNLDYWDGFLENTKQAMTIDGQVWGIPETTNGRGLLYRKDILEKYGFDVPQTGQELIEVAREITNNEEGMDGFHNTTKKGEVRAFQEWISHVYQHEDHLYERDGDGWSLVPSAETFGKIFKWFYHEVYAGDNPAASPEERNQAWQRTDNGYLQGDFAMVPDGPWVAGAATDETSREVISNTGVAHLPRAPGGQKGTYLEIENSMLNTHSTNKDVAWQGMELLSSPESLSKWSSVNPGLQATPPHTEATPGIGEYNEDMQTFTEVLETAKPLAPIRWGEPRLALYDEIQQVIFGRKDPFTAGEDLHSKLKGLEGQV